MEQLEDLEYSSLLMQAIRFLKDLDSEDSIENVNNLADKVSKETISMAAHYLVKELIPIPIDRVGQDKLKRTAQGSEERAYELLILYLGTSLLGHQVTGQFAGLSFAASERELYAASLVIKTFYNLDNPDGPDPETGRLVYRTRSSLWEKLLVAIQHRGITLEQNPPH
ncbi:MAG: hypothetical protein HPY50_16170 [Firmicutes bacterium]|nr:hypothetical protein [Bacillota bacterium]